MRIRLRLASSTTTTRTRAPSRTAVSSSNAPYAIPPSPVIATARPSRAAATADGTANPIVASPLEIRKRRGERARQNHVAGNMWAPASTATTVSGGSSLASVSTIRQPVSGLSESIRNAASALSRCAWTSVTGRCATRSVSSATPAARSPIQVTAGEP
jgi:hypothetical protein